jgi:SAM-dependent methyltransferase
LEPRVERVHGVHRILLQPWAYSLVLRLSGAAAGRREFFTDHARIPRNARVLEIGCGDGKNAEHMPEGVEYTGCDPNPKYIEHARARYGGRGTFLCAGAEDFERLSLGQFDVVFVVSVLHHLDDAQVRALAKGARAALRPGGRFLTWEPCWTPSQGWVDRFMLSLDRGRHVRTAEEYVRLLRAIGSFQVRFFMTPKSLWPQSGCILETLEGAGNEV